MSSIEKQTLSLDGENVMEQTMNNTLTKQKLILDQINQATNKHRDLIESSKPSPLSRDRSLSTLKRRFSVEPTSAMKLSPENNNLSFIEATNSQIEQEGSPP